MEKHKKMTAIYDFKALNNRGEEVDMSQYKGKVLMIVNTASKCGFTPQYDGLEALYKKYKDQGLVILGFPCDQFKHQEPGSDEEIAEFCRLNHGVTFPLMKKIDVFGENAHPIFKYLTAQVPNEEVHGLKDKATMKLVDSISKADGRKEKGYCSSRWCARKGPRLHLFQIQYFRKIHRICNSEGRGLFGSIIGFGL